MSNDNANLYRYKHYCVAILKVGSKMLSCLRSARIGTSLVSCTDITHGKD